MWEKIKKLNEERAQLLVDMKSVLKKGEDEKRDLNAEEAKRFDDLQAKADGLATQIRRLQSAELIERELKEGGKPRQNGIDTDKPLDEARTLDGFPVADLEKYSVLRAIRCLSTPGGRLDGLEAEVSAEYAKRSGKDPKGFYFPTQIPVGFQLRDMRQKGHSLETRTILDLTEGAGAIATILDVSNFIDLLRTRQVIQRMGARYLTGMTGNLAIPRQSGPGTTYWVADNSAPSGSYPTIDQVTFAPNTIGAYTDMSRKFILQTSVSAESFVREDLAALMARGIETAALNGSGSSNQPTGILQDGSVGVTALGTNGGTPTYANIVSLETAVASNNADLGRLGYVTNAKVRGLLKTTLRSSVAGATYIWETSDDPMVGEVNGYPAMATNMVPSNLTKGSASGICSAAIFGNWSDLVLAFWGNLDILVDPYTGSSSGTVRVNAHQDCDVHLRHETSFQIITDILA